MKRELMLSPDEAYDRIHALEDPEVTKDLYAFGKMLLDENLVRIGNLDSKARSTAGYAGVILAFLVARSPDWLMGLQSWQRGLMLLAAIGAFFAIASALYVMRIGKSAWFSDKQWLENEGDVLANANRLRVYYVLALHSINQSLMRSNESKANLVRVAQIALAMGGLLMAIVLATQLVSKGVSIAL